MLKLHVNLLILAKQLSRATALYNINSTYTRCWTSMIAGQICNTFHINAAQQDCCPEIDSHIYTYIFIIEHFTHSVDL